MSKLKQTAIVMGFLALLVVASSINRRHGTAAPASPPTAPIVSAVTHPAHYPGETLTVIESNGFWPCGSTPEALSELTKWAVRGDNAEVRRTLVLTRSIGLMGGMQVKVLDRSGFLIQSARVRVLTNTSGETYLRDEHGSFPADPRIGRECWIDSEALR